jgi:hypothetical protein
LRKFRIIFERGDQFEIEAVNVAQAYQKVKDLHPETASWDVLRITELVA